MMASTFEILSMLLVTLCAWGAGKTLKISGLFAPILLGLVLAACIVAILANTFARLIYPFGLLFFSLSFIATAYYAWRDRSAFRVKTYNIAPFVAFIVFYMLNEPFLGIYSSVEDEVFLNYHNHYSYYIVQSMEMLNAEYYGRLRLANNFPYEWTTYHFFDTALHAYLQIFSDPPRLASFVEIKRILFALNFAMIAEVFVGRASSGLRYAWLTFTYIALLSIFSFQISWSAFCTGNLLLAGVFVSVHKVASGKFFEAMLFSVVVGLTALRYSPFILTFWIFIPAYIYSRRSWGELRRYLLGNLLLGTRLLLLVSAAVYAVVTIAPGLFGLSVAQSGVSDFKRQFFHTAKSGWISLSVVTRYINWIEEALVGTQMFGSIKNTEVDYGNSRMLLELVFTFVVCGFVFGAVRAFRVVRKGVAKDVLVLYTATAITCLGLGAFDSSTPRLVFVLAVTAMLPYVLTPRLLVAKKHLSVLCLILIAQAAVVLSSPLIWAVKAPLFIPVELTMVSLILVYLSSQGVKQLVAATLFCLFLIAGLGMEPRIVDSISLNGRNISLTKLEKHCAANNCLDGEFVDFDGKLSNDEFDVYSVYFGKRVKFDTAKKLRLVSAKFKGHFPDEESTGAE